LVGTRIRRLRTARGLTQKELAAPRYTHAYVSSIESGHRRPSARALEHFATKLGVTTEELETGRPIDLDVQLRLALHEARLLVSSGRFDEADDGFRKVIRDATRHRMPALIAKGEEGLGLSLERRGAPEEAIERYQRAEQLLGGQPATAVVDAVAGKARCFHTLGDVKHAIYLLERQLDAVAREDLRDPHAIAHLNGDLVNLYIEAGLYRRAAEAADELELLAPRLADPLRIAHLNVNVARSYLLRGEGELAKQSLQRAEDAYGQLGFATELGIAHHARGFVLARDGQLEEARQELERARSIYEETSSEHLPQALAELGRVERLLERPDRARPLLERAIALLGDHEAPTLAWANRELGHVLERLDPDGAEKRFRIAIELFELADQTVDLAVTYRALGDLLGARGEPDASCAAYRTGILALEATA